MNKALATIIAVSLTTAALPVLAQTVAPITPTAPVTGQPVTPVVPGQPVHTGIHGAMKHLAEATNNLHDGMDDFGGHKAKALTLISQAQAELQQALQYEHHH